VVDELPVPDRLEDSVREPERQHVLDGLLAEVVIDAKDLVLGEVLPVQQMGQLARGVEVVAERLLDHEPHPALIASPLAELAYEHVDRVRGNGEVVETVARRTALLLELAHRRGHPLHALLVDEVGLEVTHPLGERLPDVGAKRVARELLDGGLHRRPKLVVCHLAAPDADDRELLRQQAAVGE
jgi:hypothetical protein